MPILEMTLLLWCHRDVPSPNPPYETDIQTQEDTGGPFSHQSNTIMQTEKPRDSNVMVVTCWKQPILSWGQPNTLKHFLFQTSITD